jgi:hypothetical protein
MSGHRTSRLPGNYTLGSPGNLENILLGRVLERFQAVLGRLNPTRWGLGNKSLLRAAFPLAGATGFSPGYSAGH